ncbi:MAG TPA: hypothetical protein VJ909_05310, partial [Prolixibacteraceae bacterium]|nr:hypothetical protein [Prolixibacteraceae bacterium]
MSETLKQNEICTFPLGDKSVLWFSEENKYVVTEPGDEEIIHLIWEEQDESLVLPLLEKKFNIDTEEAQTIADELNIYLRKQINNKSQGENNSKGLLDIHFNKDAKNLKHTYNINGIIFQVVYDSKAAKQMNHPKFAHFEIVHTHKVHFKMQVLHIKDWFALTVDDIEIGRWKESENHFLTGKFSMEILQKIYNRK